MIKNYDTLTPPQCQFEYLNFIVFNNSALHNHTYNQGVLHLLNHLEGLLPHQEVNI